MELRKNVAIKDTAKFYEENRYCVIREFKSSTISGSTQLHNSDGVIANTSDFKSWVDIEEIFDTLE